MHGYVGITKLILKNWIFLLQKISELLTNLNKKFYKRDKKRKNRCRTVFNNFFMSYLAEFCQTSFVSICFPFDFTCQQISSSSSFRQVWARYRDVVTYLMHWISREGKWKGFPMRGRRGLSFWCQEEDTDMDGHVLLYPFFLIGQTDLDSNQWCISILGYSCAIFEI